MIKNAIDLHVHTGPELIPRKFTIEKLARVENKKLKGMCIKSHFFSTMPLIKSIKNKYDLKLIGSVTLNNYVGGLNPDAIYASAKISDTPIIVWFPTISAENFLKKSRYEIPKEWVSKSFRPRLSKDVKGIKIIDKTGKLKLEAKRVLEAIKDMDCILATGHISWKESEILVKEASSMGIKKIIVTHPIYQLINMPIDVQKELANFAFIEQTIVMHTIDKIPIEKIASQIKAIGAKRCIITSDVGQVFSKKPSEALRDFINLLKQESISEKDIKQMTVINPKKLIR